LHTTVSTYAGPRFWSTNADTDRGEIARNALRYLYPASHVQYDPKCGPDTPLAEVYPIETPNPRDPNCSHPLAFGRVVATRKGSLIVCGQCSEIWTMPLQPVVGALNG
jgi:hypothetical protein